MNRFISGITLSFMALGLTTPALAEVNSPEEEATVLPSSAQRTKTQFVCHYEYEIGGETQEAVSAGTTRLAAKEQREDHIERLREEANQRGENFEVTYEFCRDPYGPN
ncbi:MAG: hypothetical protein VKK42_20895 [Lyngbya sp.]|nr:hypothetical protein [Lyngbya sp.]